MIKQLIYNNPIQLVSLLYHTVSDEHLTHLQGLYIYRNKHQFENDLDYLLRYFKAVHLPDVIKTIRSGGSFSKPAFLLTFDDGYKELYHVVAPILEKKGIPAVFFINNAFIDNRNLFYRCKAALLASKLKHLLPFNYIFEGKKIRITKKLILSTQITDTPLLDSLALFCDLDFNTYLADNKPFLTRDQIDNLLKRGFYIGSHSNLHPHFASLEPEVQLKRVITDTAELANEFKLDYKVFAFPFTDQGISSQVFENIYKNHIDLTFSTAGLKTDEFRQNLHRIPAENFSSVKKSIWFEYLYYMIKKPFNRNIRRH